MASTTVQKNMFDIVSNSKNYQQVNDASEDKISTQVTAPLKINMDEFPDPSSTPLSKQQTRKIKDSNLIDTYQNSNTYQQVNDASINIGRTKAFNLISDKERIALTLVCTKPCRNVTTLNEKGEFGVCTREHCTFAHSEQEFALPPCSFDQTCRFKYGRINHKTNTTFPGSQCKFRHSDETVEQFYRRSGNKRPYLPVTSVNSRKPRHNNVQTSTVQTSTVQTSTVQTSTLPPKNSHEEKPVSLNLKSTLQNRPTKSRWDEKPVLRTSTKSSIDEETKLADYKYSRKYDSDISSDDSSSSDSESDSHRRRRFRDSTKRKSSFENNTVKPQVIRVPNNELASIAIKAAFDRGQYNIRVIIEE